MLTEESSNVTQRALVVEDDKNSAQALGKFMYRCGYETQTANTVAELEKLADDWVPNVALVDLGLPDGEGVDVIEFLRKLGVENVIVVSGASDSKKTVDCLRAGAVDYLQKPVSANELQASLNRTKRWSGGSNIEVTVNPYRVTPDAGSLFGNSQATHELSKDIARAAAIKPCHLLITGEAGVLKPEMASLIHSKTGQQGNLVYVNCASEIDEHAEVRFFGNDSEQDPVENDDERDLRRSYLVEAESGTLLLDDISMLAKPLQAAMTRFLNTGQYLPFGALQTKQGGLAVIGVLRESSSLAIEEGRLLPEFYYALAKNEVRVPSLRERSEDIAELVEKAIAELNNLFNGEKSISGEMRKQFINYDWPGNMIEFKNVLLTSYLATEVGEEILLDNRLLPRFQNNLEEGVSNLVGNTFWEIEKKLLMATLDSVDDNKQKTAKILGISLKTLYNRLNAYS